MIEKLRLMAITDPALGWPRVRAAASLALEAGLPALMLRAPAADDDELLPIAERLREATQTSGSLLIINRHLELACRVGADGVHLGQAGPSIAEARTQLGPGVLIGYSAHAPAEALAAFAASADYVTFSPIFETPSKRGLLPPVGLGALAELARVAPGPVIALGGIAPGRLAGVLQAGAHGVALIRAIFAAADPAAATRELLGLLTPPH